MALLQSLDPQLHEALGAMNLRSAMEEQASRVHVRLVNGEGDGSWSLTRAEEVLNEGDYTVSKSKYQELRRLSPRIDPSETEISGHQVAWETRASVSEL